MTVNAGPAGFTNLAFVSVTICVPNTSNCQTINDVQVDTGSDGLRIVSSALPSTFSLPAEVSAGGPIVECVPFANSYSWGSMRIADVQIAGEQARSVPVQIIGDPAYPTVPRACSSAGPGDDTVQTFGANGLLGVGAELQDCGITCSQNASSGNRLHRARRAPPARRLRSVQRNRR